MLHKYPYFGEVIVHVPKYFYLRINLYSYQEEGAPRFHCHKKLHTKEEDEDICLSIPHHS